MERLSYGISALVSALGPDEAKVFAACVIQQRFADAVCHVLSDKAAAYVLGHVQGVYLVEDDAPRVRPSEKKEYVLHVYTDDSLVGSELDGRQEPIRFYLMQRGFTYSSMRIIQSRFEMKQRKPFQERVDEMLGIQAELDAWEPSAALTAEEIDSIVADIDDEAVKAALRRAMAATSGLASER